MINYVILSAAYRFWCGMLLITLNWNFATNSSNQYLSLAVATCISYIPALIVPFLTKSLFANRGGKRVTTIALALIIVVIIPLIFLRESNTAQLIIYFLLWFIFFVMESSWEMWFVDLSKGENKTVVDKYSSISVSTNQCALLIGPLVSPILLKYISYEQFYSLMVVFILIIAICCNKQKDVSFSNIQNKDIKIENLNKYKIFLIALMLVWPILGTFNFMLPIHVLESGEGEMLNVSLLDTAMSAGMAVVGWITLFHVINKHNFYKLISFAASIILGLIFWIVNPVSMIGNVAGLFLLGIGFGGLRIELRAKLAQNLNSREVGKMVLLGNSFSLPILIICILLIRMHAEFVWVPPFLLSLIFVILLLINSKCENKNLLN